MFLVAYLEESSPSRSLSAPRADLSNALTSAIVATMLKLVMCLSNELQLAFWARSDDFLCFSHFSPYQLAAGFHQKWDWESSTAVASRGYVYHCVPHCQQDLASISHASPCATSLLSAASLAKLERELTRECRAGDCARAGPAEPLAANPGASPWHCHLFDASGENPLFHTVLSWLIAIVSRSWST